MNKAFNNFPWEDYPSTKSPMNDVNLMKINNGLDEVDNRVITHETTKATKTEVAPLIKEIEFNESNGVFTITRKNGSKFTIDTKIEKIAINFGYDPVAQKISLTLIDGTVQYIDLSALITQYEFMDTDTVSFFVGENGKISAIVKGGSITEDKLQPNYLAEIKVEVAKAEAAATSADASKTAAASSASTAAAKAEEADISADNAANSAAAADASKTAAAASATTATNKAGEAATSAADADNSKTEAATSATNAASSASTATDKANAASQSADNAAASATSADTYAKQSQSYAVGTGGEVRENDDSDNAKYYYEQTKRISQSKNGLIPMGTITFAELSDPNNQQEGYFFDISDSFVSDERFKNGSGIFYGAGSNVLYTADGMWDVTAASMVSGVKGSVEKEYRQGFVNITKENIGLGNVANERQYSALNPQPSVAGSSGSCTGNAATATRATQDADGNDIIETYATRSEVSEIKKSVSDGKKMVADAITEKGVNTAATAPFSVMAENISMISSAINVELAGNPIVITPGLGTSSATATYDITDGGVYLIVATVGEINPSSAYDGIDLVEFKSDGEHVGIQISSSRINASGTNQGSELRKNYYHIASGNQTISIKILAHTFHLAGQGAYGMASYAEILAFKIS